MLRTTLVGLAAGFLVALAGTVPLAAQNMVRLNAGIVVADFGGDDAQGAESRTGFTLGGSYTFYFTDVVGLSLGADYTAKGAQAEDAGATLAFDVNYFEVPVLLRLQVPTESNFGVNFTAGPVVSFQSSCTLSASVQGSTFSDDCQNSETLDLGLAGGVGASVKVNDGLSIIADLVYNLGLRDLDTDASLKNRALMVRAGVAFPVGG